MTPLYGVLAAVFNRFVPRADGGYDGAMFEVAYFTDWNTGERLETFKNPYTGEVVKVPVTRSGPNPVKIDAGGVSRAGSPASAAGREVGQRFLPFRVVRDRVWLVEEIQVRMTPPSGGPAFASSSITNYSASLADVLDRKSSMAPAEVSYTALVNWRPWLNMGDRPGYLMGNAAGRTVASIDQLPPKYVALTRQLHPDVIDDPMALLKSVGAKKA